MMTEDQAIALRDDLSEVCAEEHDAEREQQANGDQLVTSPDDDSPFGETHVARFGVRQTSSGRWVVVSFGDADGVPFAMTVWYDADDEVSLAD